MRAFRILNTLTLAWCFCVVVFGAYVRLSDAGLGCPDWPGCYGHIAVPEAQHEVAAAEQQFPQRRVEAPKAWKEMIHRYLATTLGLLIVALAIGSLFVHAPGFPGIVPWLLVPLVVFQGVLGMWTVTWQLKPLAVTGHLLGGMTTVCGLLWLWLSTRPKVLDATAGGASAPSPVASGAPVIFVSASASASASSSASAPAPVGPAGIRRYALIALVVAGVQVFLGGWTSTNYAALACPDFPTCHGHWVPETDIPEAYTLWRGLGIDYEYGVLDARARVTIHFFHRVGALVVTLVMLALGGFLLGRGTTPAWRGFGIAVLGALILQVGIGIAIVKLQLPLVLAAAHNAGAAVLLLTLVSLNHYAWRAHRT